MRTFNRNAIAAAFSTMGRLVNAGEPVVFTKIDGLNNNSCVLFKEAVTHSFSEKKHGIELKRIFIPNEDGKTYHFNTSVPADYRLADDFIDKIMAAMSYVGKMKKSNQVVSKQQEGSSIASEGMLYDMTGNLVSILTTFSDEQLYAELQRREEERKVIEERNRKNALIEELLNIHELTEDDLKAYLQK